MNSKNELKLGCLYTIYEESNLHSEFQIDCEKCRKGLDYEIEATFDYKIEKASRGNILFEFGFYIIGVIPLIFISITTRNINSISLSYEQKICILFFSFLAVALALIEPLLRIRIIKKQEKDVKFALKNKLYNSVYIVDFLIINRNYIHEHRTIFGMLRDAKTNYGETIYQQDLIKNTQEPERTLISSIFLIGFAIAILNVKKITANIHDFLYSDTIHNNFILEYYPLFTTIFIVTIVVVVNSWYALIFRRSDGIPKFLNKGYVWSYARNVVNDILKERGHKV